MTPRLSGGKIGKNSIDNITDIERGKLPLFFGGWIGKKCIDNITDIEGAKGAAQAAGERGTLSPKSVPPCRVLKGGLDMNILSEKLIKRFEPVEPMTFYREIFPAGELDEWGANTKGKYAAIAVEILKQPHDKQLIKR